MPTSIQIIIYVVALFPFQMKKIRISQHLLDKCQHACVSVKKIRVTYSDVGPVHQVLGLRRSGRQSPTEINREKIKKMKEFLSNTDDSKKNLQVIKIENKGRGVKVIIY